MRMIILLLLLLIISVVVDSLSQCIDNDIFDSMNIIYPNNNDTISTTIAIAITYMIKDSQLFYDNESNLMLCIVTKKTDNDNNVKSVCGLKLTLTHTLKLYYNGYQDIIATICYNNDTNNCLCTTSVTVNNDHGPACITNTNIDTVFDIIHANTMEIKEQYYNSYTVTESIPIYELFIPIHHYITSNEISLSESQIILIKSLADSINDILSIRNINTKIHFLLHNFDASNANDKKNIDDILAWVLTLTRKNLIIKFYLCPSNPSDIDCSTWTIYNNIENFNDDAIMLVFDTNSKILPSTFMQSVDNLFRHRHPCYSLSSWSPSTKSLSSLYYIDTEVNNQYIRWGYVPNNLSSSLSNSMNDVTLAFRLSTFSYFIKKEQAITNFKDHLINLNNNNDRISIVYN